MSDKKLIAARGKKVICNPPVIAAAETASLLAAEFATAEEIYEMTDCEDRFCSEMRGIFKRVYARLEAEQ